MTTRIIAILFDVGGTLRRAHTREFSEKVALCHPIQELTGYRSDPEDFFRLLETRAKAYRKWTRQELVELDEIGFWNQWMLPEMAGEKLSSLAIELNKLWRNACRIFYVLPGARETILGLSTAGYRLGLVSNTTSSTEAPELLNELGVTDLFEAVVLSCKTGIRKPRPDMLLHAARIMGLQPVECAYIGNMPDRDVASARSAGFSRTVVIRDPEDPVDVPTDPLLVPDHFIDDFKELLGIFPPNGGAK